MRIRGPSIAALAVALIAISPTVATAHVPHTVEPGESLWTIAAANGISVERLAADNGLPPDASLLKGQTMLVPEASTASGEAPAAPSGADTPAEPAPAATAECVWDCASKDHPHPTGELVSPDTVASIAARHGMSPSLVQAMASVESGYDNGLVSVAGARGVMQIIPDTWSFIEDNLVSGPLNPQSATANVEAGVLYLRHLYRVKGGDPDGTVGAYVQGPNRDSLLPEARQYTDAVRARQAAILSAAG